jgi:hypothetical protein
MRAARTHLVPAHVGLARRVVGSFGGLVRPPADKTTLNHI